MSRRWIDRLQPRGRRVLLRLVAPRPTGAIVLTDEQPATSGIVVRAGADCREPLHPGDVVCFTAFVGETVAGPAGETYLMVDERDLLAVVA